MCDPLTAAAAAGGGLASIIGTGLQGRAQADNLLKRVRANNDVLNRSLSRTDPLAAEARGLFDQRLTDVQPDKVATDLASAQGSRADALTAAITPDSVDAIPLAGSAPKVVKDTAANRLAEAFSEAKGEATASANLRGFNDLFFNQGIAQNNAGNQLNTLNNLIGGEFALLPSEQQFADLKAANRGGSPLGDILVALGNTAASAAGSGALGA